MEKTKEIVGVISIKEILQMVNFCMHFCRNKKCNNGWIDKDLTNAKSPPPDWKYCKECAEKLGLDYDAQTPTSNLTEKELAHLEIMKERARNMREKAKQNIKSTVTE